MRAHLNGHYEGGATGETFRRSGKTDICIEAEGRAGVVAECKVWRGATELATAVHQLLGYLTWRDCKAALIVFNKHNARFSELIERMPETLRAHTNHVRGLGTAEDGEWRFVFRSDEDAGRMVTVHAFLFNLYVRVAASPTRDGSARDAPASERRR